MSKNYPPSLHIDMGADFVDADIMKEEKGLYTLTRGGETIAENVPSEEINKLAESSRQGEFKRAERALALLELNSR